MCSKGSPSTTTANSQLSNQSQNSATQGQQLQTGFSQLGPNPDTLALYNQFLQQAQNVSQTPFDINTMLQTMPWTDAQNTAANYQYGLGQQGMGFVPQSSALLGQGAQSTVGQIPGVASSLLSPWAGQAVNYGMGQGQAIGDWGTSQGTAISDYAKNLAAQGPQLQQFSQGAIDQYMSPYINDVVNATQNQFTNANAQQGNVLLGQGIRSGNAFGGDRAGVAAAQMANQQQLAQAPVIAGLYNTGYNTALGEFNTQNQLAAQLGQMAINGQIAGGQLGLQGLTAGGQLGMQGLGLGLNASQAANQQAIAALGQNQNAALQAGNMFGQLGGLQYSQNLAGGNQAIAASQLYPAYLQNLYATNQANAQAYAGYPFQTSSWYGNLLQGIGGLTGTQQQNVNAALSNYLQNVQGTAITNATGSTTPPQQNSWLQAAGLGIAGLGLLAKRGGSIPRMADGGNMPYSGGRARSYIPSGGLQPTHLAAPNTSATDIKLPNISMLTFPGLSTQGAGSAASGSSGSTSTLGQLSNLLGNKQVSSGLKSIGSFLGGTSPQASSTSVGPDTTVSVDTTPTVDTGASGQKRGGLVNYRRGGYADGGGPDDNADTFSDRFDASFPDQKQDTDTGLNLDWGAILGGQPEQATQPDVPLPTPRPPSAQVMEEPPSMQQMQRQGPRRIDFPGMQPQPQNFLQRWASNPLTQFGLGLASARGAGLTGVAEGLNLGVGNVMAQRAAQDRLDKNYKVDTSGPTMRMIYADHAIDTGLPTHYAMAEKQKELKTTKIRDPETGEDKLVQVLPDGTYREVTPQGQAGKATAQIKEGGGEQPYGKAYLDQFIVEGGKPEHAKLIEQIGNYDIDPTKIESLYRGNRKRLMEEVLKYNPDYSSPWYNAGAKSLQEFLTGGNASPAGQLTAANTAVAHAGTMSDALEDLKKVPGFLSEVGKSGMPFASYAAERLKNAAVQGTPEGVALNRYLTASRLYASEVSRMYVGGVGAETDRAHMEAPLNPNLSYKELTGAIHQSATMLKGRTNALDERREAAMSAPGLLKYSTKAVEVTNPETGQVEKRLPLSDVPALKKKAQDSIKRIEERYGAVTGGEAKGATPAAPSAEDTAWLRARPNAARRQAYDKAHGEGAAKKLLGE